MKASSPARPARRDRPAARGKPAADGPPRLPGAMDACYSRLRALVPSIPRGRRVSRVEILQHVIDYILDLQAALDAPPAPGPAARPPLTALNADVGARPLQVDVPPPLCTAADPQELAFRPLGEDSAVDGGLFSNTDASLGG